MAESVSRQLVALDAPEARIWRFMELSKFVSMLLTQALYFARPSQFHDPYEGWMPRSHIDAMAAINQNYIDGLNETRAQWHALNPHSDHAGFDREIDANIENYVAQAKRSIATACERFGINCWHKSEHESEAMWRAYPADSVAIVSTVGQLQSAYHGDGSLQIYDVRYADFESDAVEKGHEQYLLVMKRKSFEYEREVRAIRLLGDGTEGALLPYDLEKLINRVVVSPRANKTFGEAVRVIARGGISLDKPVAVSTLYAKPDYGIELNIR